MSDRAPHFDEIVDPSDADRERLEAVHELLTAAGAPPELPPRLEEAPPEPTGTLFTFPRRRFTAIGAVAVAACVLFGVGYAIGGRDSPDAPVETIAMTGPGVEATIGILAADAAGNWPMNVSVKGLPPLPKGKTYTLWLTKDGRLAESCGVFAVSDGTTKVPLNAPYPLKKFDGWVIVRTGTTAPFLARTNAV